MPSSSGPAVSVVASDRDGETRTIDVSAVRDVREQPVQLTARIDRFLDGGALWLEITTQDGTLEVGDIRWSVVAPTRLRPTAVIICTYNRADDCIDTLESLASDSETLRVVDAVYVVDQGTDTVDSREGFRRVRDVLGPILHYRKQSNLGGAGGFTRGLYEVAEVQHADHANVLFTDDDICSSLKP